MAVAYIAPKTIHNDRLRMVFLNKNELGTVDKRSNVHNSFF